MSRVYQVPVVLNVQATSDEEAAELAACILEDAAITQDHRKSSGLDDYGPIENWFLPNHQQLMGDSMWSGYEDDDDVLDWTPYNRSSLYIQHLQEGKTK